MYWRCLKQKSRRKTGSKLLEQTCQLSTELEQSGIIDTGSAVSSVEVDLFFPGSTEKKKRLHGKNRMTGNNSLTLSILFLIRAGENDTLVFITHSGLKGAGKIVG
jgi:hypothetical protein